MWAVVIEVSALCRHQIAGMAQIVEQLLVQQLVHCPAVHVFIHERVACVS